MRRHICVISSRVRIRLRSDESVGIDTVPTTVQRLLNGVARGSSRRPRFWLVIRRFAYERHLQDLSTVIPAVLQRFTRFASDQDGHIATTRGYVPIQSARSCDVRDGIGRDTRKRRAISSDATAKRFLLHPLLVKGSLRAQK